MVGAPKHLILALVPCACGTTGPSGEPLCWDHDDDGYLAYHCGGDDCDDMRADVHPGATEICLDDSTCCRSRTMAAAALPRTGMLCSTSPRTMIRLLFQYRMHSGISSGPVSRITMSNARRFDFEG